jgi:hypothetical protein
MYRDKFKFLPPPYEYEFFKMPIDILFGRNDVRSMILNDVSYDDYSKEWLDELKKFQISISKYLLYE